MTDQELAVKFAEKVLGWHKQVDDRDWLGGTPSATSWDWVNQEGRVCETVIGFQPCTDLNQAVQGVNTKTHKLLLESPQDGEDSWWATLVRHDDPQNVLGIVWDSKPARAIVRACLEERR